MHIDSDTKNFDYYQVFVKTTTDLPRRWWHKLFRVYPTITFEETVDWVLEADDKTGLLVVQVHDANGPWYTNGLEELQLTNTVKFLLLNDHYRLSFMRAQFVPKLTRTYVPGLIIKYRGPQVEAIVDIDQLTDTLRTEVPYATGEE